jgi:septum formation protein
MKSKKKIVKRIILASKSKVRKKILEENGINCLVKPANVDEDLAKKN